MKGIFVTNVWTKFAAVLGAAGVLAFGTGFAIGKIQSIYRDGIAAGRIEMALEQRAAAEEARLAAEKALSERDADTARKIAAAETRAGDAEKARNRALAALRSENNALDQCLALPYPDRVRAHRPIDRSLRDGAAPAGDGDHPG